VSHQPFFNAGNCCAFQPPLYYRLLTGYGSIRPKYTKALTASILNGLRRRKDGKD